MQLHPAYTVATQAFKPSSRGLALSAYVDKSVEAHGRTSGLTVVGRAWSRGPLLQAEAGVGPQISAGTAIAGVSDREPRSLQADTEPGLHDLRVIACGRLLQTSSASRLES